MCNCCNGTGHQFESHGMKCKVVIRNSIMEVCLPWNSAVLEVKVCPLCGRILEKQNDTDNANNMPIAKQEKQFNPALWKPVGFKEVDASGPVISEGHHGFVEYQAPDDRYEVRGVMPKAPKYPRRDKKQGPGYE